MEKKPVHISEIQKKAIENVLQKGNRVELIPNKDGFRIIGIKRKEVKPAEDAKHDKNDL